MPRRCSVCVHGENHAVNVALVAREPYRTIADRYGLSQTALKRHLQEHIPRLLVKARDAVEVAEAGDLLSRIEDIQRRTLAILEAVEGTENYPVALAAIREARQNLELIGRVTKELASGPTLNIHLNPEYLELQALILTALEPYGAAKGAVVEALEEAEHAAH